MAEQKGLEILYTSGLEDSFSIIIERQRSGWGGGGYYMPLHYYITERSVR